MAHSTVRILKRYYKTVNFAKITDQIHNALPEPAIDLKKVISNLEDVKEELALRKHDLYEESLSELTKLSQQDPKKLCKSDLDTAAVHLPNSIHPSIRDYKGDFRIVKHVGKKREYPFTPLNGAAVLNSKDLLRMDDLNQLCGNKSYYLVKDAANLEQALVHYTIPKLLKKGFRLISVPDLLNENIIERCGMKTKSHRTQVYRLDSELFGPEWCLSGTAEMSIAAFLMNSNVPRDSLPIHYTAVSRCYRAEISDLASEKGLYRVHQFTKVEMFSVCLPDQSDQLLEMYLDIQEELFSAYDLHYRIIDMAPHELGRQAYRKYDIEAWMPGLNRYGEISSCSNCTDYQARRLNIKSGDTFLHTVNGTACAIPRTINAIAETHQTYNGRITVPEVLRPFTGVDTIGLKRGPNLNKVERLKNINLD